MKSITPLGPPGGGAYKYLGESHLGGLQPAAVSTRGSPCSPPRLTQTPNTLLQRITEPFDMSEAEFKQESPMSVPVLIRQDTQPALPTYHRRFANPAPLGVFSFGAPVFMLSMYMVNTDGVQTENLIVGMALICGGFGQFCAGMWEMACGNTFGATLFGLFSTFWGSYGLIFLPGTGILAAYTASPATAAQLHNAIGIYLITWFILGVILTLGALRTSIAMLSLATMICSTILVLAISEFTQKASVTKAAGAMGIVTGLLTFYVGAASLYTDDNTIFTLPTGPFARKKEHHQA